MDTFDEINGIVGAGKIHIMKSATVYTLKKELNERSKDELVAERSQEMIEQSHLYSRRHSDLRFIHLHYGAEIVKTTSAL